MTCQHYQSQLLHLAYDAVADSNSAELKAHLASCPDCQAAFAKAESQRKILAQAARGKFSGFRFQNPVAGRIDGTTRRPAGRGPTPWLRWAVAAAVLLILGGLTTFGLVGWFDHRNAVTVAQHARARAEERVREVESKNQIQIQATGDEVRDLKTELDSLVTTWRQESQKAEMVWKDKDIQLTVQGPKTLQAGARNQFQIQVTSRSPQALASLPVSVRVVDPVSKAELFKETLRGKQTALIDLPPDLPVPPGANLSLEITADKADGTVAQIRELLPLVVSHFVTHVTTDRPMYRPGDMVYFRSLTLERFSLKPADVDLQTVFEIRGPKGNEVMKPLKGSNLLTKDGKEPLLGPDGQRIRGIGCGQFQLPQGLSGGEYSLIVSDLQNRFPQERRKFIVNNYQPPRLIKELEYTRKSYGPGDRVEGVAKVSRVEGGVAVAQQAVKVTLWVDGGIKQTHTLRTDHEGKARIDMRLPATISREDASVSLQFFDSDFSETLVRPVPLVLGRLNIEFFPEGGDLIGAQSNRVYFQVTNTIGKAADLKGRIVDAAGKTVTKIETFTDDKEPSLNQGMGSFEFTPQAGQSYELVVDSPIGVKGPAQTKGKFLLPAAKADGVVLNIPSGVVEGKIDVNVRSAKQERKLLVGVYCRGRLLDQSEIVARQGETTPASLKSMPGVSGVYRVTVFERTGDKTLRPVAERLVYRKSVERLQFNFGADQEAYAPGDKAKVTIMSQNEGREAAPAILLVAVSDFGVLKLADEKTARTMPTHFHLTTEVRKADDLEYADFLVSAHPKAPVALDLLLGTQGWRRFAEQYPQEFQKKNAQDAIRLLALSGQAPKTTTLAKMENKRIDERHATQYVALQKRLAEREAQQEQMSRDLQTSAQQMRVQAQLAAGNVSQASQSLVEYERTMARVAIGVIIVCALLASLALLAMGLLRMANGQRLAAPFCIAGGCILGVVFLGSLMGIAMIASGRNEAMRAVFGEVAAAKMAPMAAQAEMAVDAPAPMVPGRGGPEGVVAFGMADAAPRKADAKMFRMAADPLAVVAAPVPPPAEAPLVMLEAERLVPEQQPALVGPAGARRQIMGGWDGGLARREETLRRRGDFEALAKMQLGREIVLHTEREPFVLREYAHKHQENPDQVRRDFTETLYWHPALVLMDGRAEITFDLSDSATRFQVLAMGHALDGRLGSGTFEIASRLSVSVEPKVPEEISNGDKLLLPITLGNDSKNKVTAKVDVELPNIPGADDKVVRTSLPDMAIEPGRKVRHFFTYQSDMPREKVPVRVIADFGMAGSDRVERNVRVVPEGFPFVGSESGILEKSSIHTINLPQTWVPGTLQCKVEVFPSSLADLQKGLEGLLREPCGCFEQSSTSNYPNVLILNYLQESKQAAPEIEQRARGLLTNGYGKLTSFECIDPKQTSTRRGYEWFGQTAPPHEALTAYGLLQFHDMAKVYAVDPEMVKRTRQYLLAQRDGNGGFKRNPRAIDSFGRAPDHITSAYVLWSLTETGDDDVQKELTALSEKAKTSKDPYFVSLVSLSLLNRSKTAEGLELLNSLKALQNKEGHLEGATTSITGSRGRDLQIESTALALLAWLRANRPEQFHTNVEGAIRWITKQRGGHGAFGSTQSTILALKALIAHTRENTKTANAGTLSLKVVGVDVGVGQKRIVVPSPSAQFDFPAGIREPMVVRIPNEQWLRAGPNKLVVEITNQKSTLPYTLSWTYNTLQPANPEKPPVELTVSLDRPTASEGQTAKLKAVVENKTDEGHGMTVAILGLPAGVTLPENLEQLRDMTRLRDDGTKPGLIGAFEIKGRELILYWRDLAPRQKIDVELDVICTFPGEFRGPASRAYLYYNADQKYWVEPLAITIEAKE